MDFYTIANVRSAKEFEKFIDEAVFDKDKREQFYDALIAGGADLSEDLFLDYFQTVNAERKTNKQDYTPTALADLMARAVKQKETKSVYDAADGSGCLLVAEWAKLKKEGKEKGVTFYAKEIGDNVISYLIHNLAIRNTHSFVIHGDSITHEVFRAFELVPTQRYSNIFETTDIDEIKTFRQERTVRDGKEY